MSLSNNQQRERLAAKVEHIVAGVRGQPLHAWYYQFGDLEMSLILHPAIAVPLVAAWIEDADAQVRRWAAQMLVKLDRDGARPILARLVDDADPDIRWIAADAVADVEALWSLTGDKLYLLRAALDRLAAIAAPGTAARLVALLPEPDWNRRNQIVGALGALGDEGAAALRELASHPDDETRAFACSRLDSISLLCERLDDPCSGVVSSAAHRLGHLDDAAAIDRLLPLLESPDESVAGAAVFALGKLGADSASPELTARLRDGRGDRRRLIDALGNLSPTPDIEAALIEVVDDYPNDPSDALAAARALTNVGTARCVPALERFLAEGVNRLTKRQRKDARVLGPAIARLRG